MFLGVATLFISWGLAIPFGIFAATRKNSRWDYFLSTLSFIGISTPDFLVAVIYLFIAVFVLKTDYSGGLFSQEFKDAPWSWARVVDFAKHLPVPLTILGLGGMAGTFRIMRANLLDILDQQFVEAARANGLRERIVVYLVTLFAGFFSPYTACDADSKLTYSPPMAIRLQDPETGNFHLPFFYPLRGKRNMESFQLEYVAVRERRIPIQFFVKGEPYKALGVIAWVVHLFGSSDPEERLHIMGSDVRGRDLFLRIIYGGQVSLSVGIFGVMITIAAGSVIGTLSGYYGGSDGKYRGFPNLAHPENHFHPGDGCRSRILKAGPLKITIAPASVDGKWACRWENCRRHWRRSAGAKSTKWNSLWKRPFVAIAISCCKPRCSIRSPRAFATQKQRLMQCCD